MLLYHTMALPLLGGFLAYKKYAQPPPPSVASQVNNAVRSITIKKLKKANNQTQKKIGSIVRKNMGNTKEAKRLSKEMKKRIAKEYKKSIKKVNKLKMI